MAAERSEYVHPMTDYDQLPPDRRSVVTGESGVLTREVLQAAFDQIANQEMRPHEHVLHPRSLTVDGFYPCDCGLVPVSGGRVDWEWGIAQMKAKPLGSSPTP